MPENLQELAKKSTQGAVKGALTPNVRELGVRQKPSLGKQLGTVEENNTQRQGGDNKDIEIRMLDDIDFEGGWQPVDVDGNDVAADANNIADYRWIGFTEVVGYRYETGKAVYNSIEEMPHNTGEIPQQFNDLSDQDVVAVYTAPEGTVANPMIRDGNSASYWYSNGPKGISGSGFTSISQHNLDKINTLHPDAREDFKELTLRLQIAMRNSENEVYITDAWRTEDEQDILYGKGRTQAQLNKVGLSNVTAKPKLKKVTNARGGYSNHNFGLAIDIATISPNRRLVYPDDATYLSWGLIGEELNFTWGGRWTGGDRDQPHFEWPHGLTMNQLRALPEDADGYKIL